MSTKKYGILLKSEREKKSVSQKALADSIGVSRRSIEYWEHGKRQMTLENADNAFRALGVSVVIGEGGQADE